MNRTNEPFWNDRLTKRLLGNQEDLMKRAEVLHPPAGSSSGGPAGGNKLKRSWIRLWDQSPIQAGVTGF